MPFANVSRVFYDQCESGFTFEGRLQCKMTLHVALKLSDGEAIMMQLCFLVSLSLSVSAQPLHTPDLKCTAICGKYGMSQIRTSV